MVGVFEDSPSHEVDVARTVLVTKKTKRSKIRDGLASKLFDKFERDRQYQYDPFSDSDPVIQDSKAGMENLLSMSNPVEIDSLYGALGFVEPCPRRAKEHQIMEAIRKSGRQVRNKFSEVLRLFWEGLLYEYLRSVGCPLRDSELDPRDFVLRYWRRGELDPSVPQSFVPFYLQRQVKQRSSINQEDKDIRDIRAGLMACEKMVKETEQRVRENHDYRFVLQYFCTSRELHRTLGGNVNYLANEVEQLRAQVDHSSESIAMMEQQHIELETKYDRVVGGLVHRGAFQQTLENVLYGMINDGHLTLRAAEEIADELLAGMEVGPEEKGDDATGVDIVNSSVRSKPCITLGSMPEYDTEVTEVTGGQQADEERWTAPQPGGSTTIKRESMGSSGDDASVRSAEAAPSQGKDCVDKQVAGSPLGHLLAQVGATHRKACTSYASLVAEMGARNAALTVELSEATRARDDSILRAAELEARHGALKERLAGVENVLRGDLAEQTARAERESARARIASDVLRDMLERVTPTLLDMVSALVPRDTQELGVELLQALDVKPEEYSHAFATRGMFQADLESRAFEVMTTERERAASEVKSAEQEGKTIAIATENGGRGRPKSRGKAASEVRKKGKGESKSKSRPNPATDTDIGGKSDRGSTKAKAEGKQKSASARRDKGSSPALEKGRAKTQRSPSPVKKGGAKGNKSKV